MTDPFELTLTYRGPLGHRGVNISHDTHGKLWTFRLAEGMWRLIDHQGEVVHAFTQENLCRIVVLPGTMRGYPDLYFFGLGRSIHCFTAEPAVVEALKPYFEASQRANAPRLARWHRGLGIRLLALGSLALAVCVAVLCWVLWSYMSNGLRFNIALMLIPACLIGGGCFIAGGMRDLRKAKHFAGIAEEHVRPTS